MQIAKELRAKCLNTDTVPCAFDGDLVVPKSLRPRKQKPKQRTAMSFVLLPKSDSRDDKGVLRPQSIFRCMRYQPKIEVNFHPSHIDGAPAPIGKPCTIGESMAQPAVQLISKQFNSFWIFRHVFDLGFVQQYCGWRLSSLTLRNLAW